MKKPVNEVIFNKLVKLGVILPSGTCDGLVEYRSSSVEGYMDLIYERRAHLDNYFFPGTYVISLAHTYLQNGDVMSDPYMEIIINPSLKTVEPQSFTNSGLNLYQEVFVVQNGGTGFRPKLRTDLTSFLNQWCSNLLSQGHTPNSWHSC